MLGEGEGWWAGEIRVGLKGKGWAWLGSNYKFQLVNYKSIIIIIFNNYKSKTDNNKNIDMQ